jgi:hypothetical protein
MERAEFWKLIAEAKEASRGDLETQLDIIETRLGEYSPEEIVSFQSVLHQLMDESYTRDLWAAAYILNGGCSDDCFDYFRGWLIAQGEHVYNEALRDPETLAPLAAITDLDDYAFESILYAAWTAYEEKTGQEIPLTRRKGRQLTGEEWDEDNVEDKYPKLAAAVGYRGEDED